MRHLMISALLFTLAAPAVAGTSFEDTVRTARAQGPTAQMGAQDLAIARHRYPATVRPLTQRIERTRPDGTQATLNHVFRKS